MLEIKKITAGYGRRTVLRELSVTFAAGKVTAVIGANGCGKSTLLKAALGIIPRAQGEVLSDGVSLGALPRIEIARRVAYLTQESGIPAMTVSEMALCGRFPYRSRFGGYTRRDREIASAAMERVGIAHLADEPLAALSGGVRQTARLAMALTQDTPYLLLDEPATYLDVAHQIALMRLLRELASDGRGVAAVMHDLPLALTYADEVAVMAEGRVIAFGTPRELSRSGVIERVFGVRVREADGEFSCCLRGEGERASWRPTGKPDRDF